MKKFYLGMDIGTDSVGMACTDECYNLLRAKRKDLWAVRLFDEAKPAAERRLKRTARRRLQRRRQRIEFLQGVFAPLMQDTLFFLRLNNSGFYEEDKQEGLRSRFSLFADTDYTDVDFYKQYPTVFHLRDALIKGRENGKFDLRLYYLALHHIIKYRGHFLIEGENVGDVHDIKKLFESYNMVASEVFPDDNYILPIDKAEEFRKLAMSRKGINDKKKEAVALFGIEKTGLKEIAALLVGATVKAASIFGDDYAEKYKGEKLSFKDMTDETFDSKKEVFDDEHISLLEAARAIYNFIVVEKILGGRSTVSASMIAIYDKHEKDLKDLKQFVKQNYSRNIYYRIFRSAKEEANYANYVGHTKIKTKRKISKCKPEEFFKFLKKILSDNSATVKDEAKLKEIQSEIADGTFLPKILHSDNGLFPHQINGIELDMILENLCRDYPEFAVSGDDGYTAADKIKKIFLFKIPYYVGPLNAAHENAWVVRKKGKITPWNFDESVDKAASNEQFICRMTNKCTYLHNQDVLPKGSMYYQAFDTLNQLNVMTLNGEPLSVELKKDLFNNVFLLNKKVSKKQILNYLVSIGKCTLDESLALVIGGVDGEFNANMSSYVTLKSRLGTFVDEHPEICEDIIFWHTLNTDKSLVERMILDKYGEEPIIRENIKWLKGLTSFKKFGRLSKKLLCELSGGVDPVTGEIYTVLGRLYHTNYNFNRLLTEYAFEDAIADENAGNNDIVTYDDVADLYVSPMVRRGIWQALQMADEYVDAVGRAPDKIFIEVTRRDDVKERTVSRKNKILELYNGLGTDCNYVDELLKELNGSEMTDARLRQERLYLYFLQLGCCAYTGERIHLDQLPTDQYDVDHIMPRSITKDDSIENKVLVKREKNREKSDEYPLPAALTSQRGFWKMLKSKGLMSEKKYALLTRTKPLTNEDFQAFINRQLVITNQTTKAVAELLKRKYEAQGTRIVYSKAVNVDDFKHRYDIVKCRETNDLHHARDAYLNIVVGNVYDTKFTSAYDYFRRVADGWREYNLDDMFKKPVNGAWSGSADVARIKAIAAKTSMQVTRYSYTDKGMFYKESIFGKDSKSVSYPRKGTAPYNIKDENGFYKYGGYSNVQNAYFVALEYADGKKRKRVVLGLPVMTEYRIKGDVEKIKQYFEETAGLKDVKILIAKIRKDTLISYNGYKGYITGASDNRITFSNAVQWFSNVQTDRYVKAIFKLLDMVNKGKITPAEQESEFFEMHTNRLGKSETVIDRMHNGELYHTLLQQISRPIYQTMPAFITLKDIMQSSQSVFLQKTVYEQAKVLANIVAYLRRGGSSGVDLSILGKAARACILRVGYDITKVDFEIIHQSPCGLVSRIQKV